MYQYYHSKAKPVLTRGTDSFTGIFQVLNQQDYRFEIASPAANLGQTYQLVTLRSHINEQLQALTDKQHLTVRGRLNPSGHWLLVEHIETMHTFIGFQ